ncbi:hypothetical protein [Bacillus sp. V3B]|nr:hypothetical protein [Bacillus sp. V3B]
MSREGMNRLRTRDSFLAISIVRLFESLSIASHKKHHTSST